MRIWLRNVTTAVSTIARSMYVTLHTFVQSYIRRPFTAYFQYPERPAPIRPRYRGFHRFDLTTCPVDCIYIEKEKAPPPLKGFVITGFKIDYTKCMFCALCVDPCPVDCLFMSSTYDLSTYSRDGCIVDFAKLPLEVAWGQDTLNPTAVLESKRLTLPVWTKVPAAPTEAAAPSTAAGSATAAPSSVSGSGG
jgi:NADH-quinone oxidoreductase subunit I